MRKFFIGLLSVVVLSTSIAPATSAFRDIGPNSKLLPALQNLMKRGVIEEGSFFRAEDTVPAKMFWEVILRDGGFDGSTETLDTPLPPNIEASDLIAPFIREAVRRNFIDPTKPFDKDAEISRIEAIKIIVRSKGIIPPRTVSQKFKETVSGVSLDSTDLPAVEAAYASKILEDSDIRPLRPSGKLLRKDLVTWLFRFADHGVRQSRLETVNSSEVINAQKQIPKPSATKKSSSKTNEIQIEILGNGTVSLSKKSSSNNSETALPNEDVLNQIFQDVVQKYRFGEILTADKKRAMIDAAIAGMVKAVGDKYTNYIEPDKSKDFEESLKGNFEGIGAYVEMVDNKFTITAPIKGSPAEAAGILPGDVVTKVNDKSVDGNSLTDIINLIKGPSGTPVRLTIARNGTTVDVSVTRGKITIPSVTLEWKDSIPIIGIHQFNETTVPNFEKILNEEVLQKNPRGMILDLRNNPGGLLETAGKLGEEFVQKGTKIFSTDQKTGVTPYFAQKTGKLVDQKNIVVLQNKGTASASEIFIGMLQDFGMAKIVGTQSLGKGTVQSVNNYTNGGILKLTIAKWLTPKGRWINETGITPDVVIADPTAEEVKAKQDKQLEQAVSIVLER